jgi:hypothetical protein
VGRLVTLLKVSFLLSEFSTQYLISFVSGDYPTKHADNPFPSENDGMAKEAARKILNDYQASSGELSFTDRATGKQVSLGMIQAN